MPSFRQPRTSGLTWIARNRYRICNLEFAEQRTRSTAMKGQRLSRTTVAVLCAVCGSIAFLSADEPQEAPPGTVRIGLVRTLFRDVPEPMVRLMMQPFNALMKAQTVVSGDLIPCDDPCDLGKRLHEGMMELGVFHGFEFGWAQ